MPELPQFRANKPIAELPGVVKDNVSRPRMDLSGPINAISRLTGAMKGTDASQHMQEVGPEAFGGQSARALGAIGQGVQAVGAFLGEIQERKMEAQNYIDMAEAEAFLDGEYAKFQNEYVAKNPGNPDSWGTEWERRSEQAVGKLAEKGYSPMVRDKLAAETQRWRGKTSIRVATDATRSTFERARITSEARLDLYKKQGNKEAFVAETTNYQRITGAPDEVIQGMSYDFVIETNSKSRENLRTVNPRAVEDMLKLPKEEWLPEYQGLSESEVQDERQRVAASLAQGKALVIANAKQDMAEGRLLNENQWLKQYQQRDPNRYLSYPEVNKLGKMIGAVDNDPVLFEQFHGSIAKYDANQDPTGIQRATLESQIDLQFTDSHAKELKSQLAGRVDKSTAGDDAFDGEFKAALEEVDVTMNAGGFGSWQVPVENVSWDAAAQSWVRQPESWENSTGPVRIQVDQEMARKLTNKDARKELIEKGVLISDLAGKAKAAQQAAMIRRTLEEGRKSGLYKTPEDMRIGYRNMMEGTSINEARGVLEAPAVPMEGDMPSMQQGGQVDPSLFDSIFNQTR